MNEIKNQLGNVLRALRIDREMKQSEIAARLGISISAYSHYECGKRSPDFNMLILMSKIYKININYLFFLACNDAVDEKEITTSDIYEIFSTVVNLTKDENRLLELYRSIPSEYQKDVLSFCEAAYECIN